MGKKASKDVRGRQAGLTFQKWTIVAVRHREFVRSPNHWKSGVLGILEVIFGRYSQPQ